MNYYPRHIGDYVSATAHLSMLEDGAYNRLLDWYYLDEKPLPADPRAIYRRMRASQECEREAVDVVLKEFFTLTDDGYRHLRCDAEIGRAREKSEKARSSARLGVEARGNVSPRVLARTNAGLRQSRMEAARAIATHTPGQWSALMAFCGGACVKCGSSENVQKDHIQPVYQGGSDGIENLQPLCKSCNTSKSAEVIDYRPDGWCEAVAQRLLTGEQRSLTVEQQTVSSQEPITNNQEPITNTSDQRSSAKRSKPRTGLAIESLPDDWRLKAQQSLPGWDHDGLFRAFAAHHEAKGTLAASWPATWTTWLLNAPEYSRRFSPGGGRSGPNDSPYEGKYGQVMAELTGGLMGRKANAPALQTQSDQPYRLAFDDVQTDSN